VPWLQVAAAAAASVWTEAPSISMQTGGNSLSTINIQWKKKTSVLSFLIYGFHDSLPWENMLRCACLSSKLSNECSSKECEGCSHMVMRWVVETSNTSSSPLLLHAFGLHIIDSVGMGARPAIQFTRCERNQDNETRQKYSRRQVV